MQGRAQRPLPRAKFFCGEGRPSGLAQIAVHVGRAYGPTCAARVDVLEQALSWDISAVFDDLGEPSIEHFDDVSFAAFAAKIEGYSSATNARVPILQCRQAVRTIAHGVLVV